MRSLRLVLSALAVATLAACSASDAPSTMTAPAAASASKVSKPSSAAVASVTVTPGYVVSQASTVQFTAQGYTPYGVPVATTYIWSSSDPVNTPINAQTGLAQISATSSAIITAKAANGVAGQANVGPILSVP
jgi:hypothetical protein